MKAWGDRLLEIEGILESALPPAVNEPAQLHEAMRYSTLEGGKRLRALLALGACEAVDGDPRKAHGLVAALEMIHAYSLIHDDLPCMDDDDLRRGKPTNHKVYGEALAVLAGDALLTAAFLELARMSEKYGVPPPISLRVIAEIAKSAGPAGMVGGQTVDILLQGKAADAASLNYIHAHKTGALIGAAVRGGAIIGGASEEELAALTKYAKNFGLAFQISDDILDETGDLATLGKSVGRDRNLEKQTFPRLYGLGASQKMVDSHIAVALESLSGFSSRARLLRDLASFISKRDH